MSRSIMITIPAERIGIDVGRKLPLEDAIGWAGRHDVGIIDIQLDTGANVVTGFDQARAHAIRRSCDHHAIRLGLHTLSAVNIAEYAPLVAEAVDAYLRAYIDAAVLLGAEWIVVHAGFHFSADVPQRMQAALDRLRRIADYADRKAVLLLLENLNKEPPEAEVHYLAHTIEEWRWFYEKLDSPALQLSFTANHAHLVPEGVAGFIDAMPLQRVREVRLADCFRNGHEEHLNPGQGDFDFAALFRNLEAKAYTGHYMNAFGSLDDMLKARAMFAGMATD
jgi:sugar phosphate isomerase/epimerase